MKTLYPLRSIDEHEVIPFFAYTGSSGDKGLPVMLNSSLSGYVASDNWNLQSNLSSFANVYSPRWENKAKVVQATSGNVPYGILLRGVRETNQWGESYMYDAQRKAEGQYSVSGEPVPIARKGLFRIGPFTTGEAQPAPGKFVILGTDNDYTVSTASTGAWTHAAGQTGVYQLPTFGLWLGVKDANGYATAEINCYK